MLDVIERKVRLIRLKIENYFVYVFLVTIMRTFIYSILFIVVWLGPIFCPYCPKEAVRHECQNYTRTMCTVKDKVYHLTPNDFAHLNGKFNEDIDIKNYYGTIWDLPGSFLLKYWYIQVPLRVMYYKNDTTGMRYIVHSYKNTNLTTAETDTDCFVSPTGPVTLESCRDYSCDITKVNWFFLAPFVLIIISAILV